MKSNFTCRNSFKSNIKTEKDKDLHLKCLLKKRKVNKSHKDNRDGSTVECHIPATGVKNRK